MEITLQRKALITALKRAKLTLQRRYRWRIPILEHALLEVRAGPGSGSVALLTTDLTVYLRQKVLCTIAESGTCTFPVAAVAKVLPTLPERDVTLSVGDGSDKLLLECGSAHVRFSCLPVGEFPSEPQVDGKEVERLIVSQAQLSNLLKKTSFAMSDDKTRANLVGVYFGFRDDGGTLGTVSMDGCRLAVYKVVSAALEKKKFTTDSLLLPRRASPVLEYLLREDDDAAVTIYLTELGREARRKDTTDETRLGMACFEGRVRFSFDDYQVIVKLAAEQYPDYAKILPTGHDNTALLDRAQLQAALQRARAVAPQDDLGVRLTVDGDVLTLTSTTSCEKDGYWEELPVECTGEWAVGKYDLTFILDVLRAAAPLDKVCLHIKAREAPPDPPSRIVYHPSGFLSIDFPDDPEWHNVLMPIRDDRVIVPAKDKDESEDPEEEELNDGVSR